MSSPHVSVVMPVFNQVAYVQAAIKSILDQSFSDFEFVIIDDGSTDGTSQALDSIRDRRVRLIRIPHSGFLTALRAGVEQARGTLIARMDSDDICHPQRLEREVTFLDAHPECLFVSSSYGLVTPRGYYLAPRETFEWRYISANDITLGKQSFCDPSTVFRRHEAVAVELYDSDFENNEKALWYKLLARGRGAVLGDPLYCARWLPSSISRDERGFERRREVHRLVRFRYDPEFARKVFGTRQEARIRSSAMGVARRAVELYLLAGDKASARQIAVKGWKRFPHYSASWGLLLRSLIGKAGLRFWSPPREHPVYRSAAQPW